MNKDNNIDLSVRLGSMHFTNPVIAAAGTFGYGIEFDPFVDLNKLGGFCTKGLSMKPKMGNRFPRMIETASGMLNSIGLENIGLDKEPIGGRITEEEEEKEGDSGSEKRILGNWATGHDGSSICTYNTNCHNFYSRT